MSKKNLRRGGILAQKERDEIMTPQGKTIYLPSIYDPKKVREGITEIINLVKMQEQKGAKKTG